MRPWLYPLLYAGLVLLSGPVAASDGDIVRDLQEGFRDSVALWYAPLQQVATWLLLSLAVISYTWSASQMVLRNADLGEFVAEFVRLVIFTGFFLFLIQGGQQLAETMIKGWMDWRSGYQYQLEPECAGDPGARLYPWGRCYFGRQWFEPDCLHHPGATRCDPVHADCRLCLLRAR